MMRNATLQGAYLILAARSLGLDTGPMSGFSNEKVDAAFFAGTSIKSNFLCALGVGTTEAAVSAQPAAAVRRGVPDRLSAMPGLEDLFAPRVAAAGSCTLVLKETSTMSASPVLR